MLHNAATLLYVKYNARQIMVRNDMKLAEPARLKFSLETIAVV